MKISMIYFNEDERDIIFIFNKNKFKIVIIMKKIDFY